MNDTAKCPDLDELKALADGATDKVAHDCAAHIYVCEKCRKTLENLMYPRDAWRLPDDESETIRRFVAAKCTAFNPLPALRKWLETHGASPFGASMGAWRQAAAGGAASGTAAAEPLEIVFVSENGSGSGAAWRAELVLPAANTPGAKVPVKIETDEGKAPDGVFTVCNQRVKISGGVGEMSFQSFIAGLRDSKVEFAYAGGAKVPGVLALL